MDVFSITFDDGEKFCLMAKDSSTARLTAQELNPKSTILKVERIDEWFDNG